MKRFSRAQKLLLLLELTPALLLMWLYFAQRARLERARPWYFGANAAQRGNGEARVRFSRFAPDESVELVSGRVDFGLNAYGDHSRTRLAQTTRYTWRRALQPEGEVSWPRRSATTPDGTRRLEHHGEREILLRDLASGRVLQRIQTSETVSALAISRSGRLLASGGQKRVELWSENGERLFTLRAANVSRLRFSPNETVLGVAGGWLYPFDTRTGAKQPTRLTPSGASVSDFDFSPDEKTLILRDYQGHTYHAAWPDKTTPVALSPQLKSNSPCLAFAPDGRLAVGGNGEVQLWSKDGQLRRTMRTQTAFERPNDAAPTADASANAVQNRVDMTANVAGNVAPGAAYTKKGEDDSAITALAWSRDGDTLMAQTERGVLLWKTR